MKAARVAKEFGYRGSPLRITNGQELAILEVRGPEKRSEAKTVPVHSPVGEAEAAPAAEVGTNTEFMLMGSWYADVAEVYSPPRVAAEAWKQGRGSSTDITTTVRKRRPWDLTDVTMRSHAFRRLLDEKPFLLVGSRMCSHQSTIMQLSYIKMSAEGREKMLEKARIHIRVSCQLYKKQHLAGRSFLHEHPAAAKSWEEECIKEVMHISGAMRSIIKQRQYGLAT